MQTSEQIPDELLVQAERLNIVSRRRVRRQIRFRCRVLAEEAFLRWYAELIGAIGCGKVEPGDMMSWRPAGLPSDSSKGPST